MPGKTCQRVAGGKRDRTNEMSGKSFGKGLSILDALAASNDPMTLGEIAARCQLGKSNTHQFLTALVERNYVRQSGPRGHYELTFKVWEMGAKIVNRLDLGRVARDPMRKLSIATGESVSLAILDKFEVLYIDKMDGQHDVRTHPNIGRRRPAYCVASGKALLAFQSADVIDKACSNMQSFTDQTVSTVEALQAQLAEIRESGYAFNRGEWTARIRGVSAPIRDATGKVIAAVGISMPTERLPIRAVQDLAPKVVECGQEISCALGFR
jgi:IclR family transcriptional regulator, KDG regulon repressor